MSMPLSQRRQKARLILFYKIINGLAQVPFEGVLVEAYKGTRRKHNMKFRQILSCYTLLIRTTIISGACKRTHRDTSMPLLN